MEALLAVCLLFLPAIIYFVRSPFRPSNADVLASLLGIWLAVTVVIYLGNWIFPRRGGYWAAAIGWLALCVYSWHVSGAERSRRDELKRNKLAKNSSK